ncbi:tyrosine-type recombinase/integrase [Methanosarcina sp. T3]|uniref:tyrosine-type recombinase/integrase n=1 Tax=Methanosarcina sp. T3 TaxID=3439062 RepID=UPI003F8723C5
MNYKELKDDKYIKDWLSGIGAKKTTREGYTDSMRAFTEFLDKTPEQIILESEEDIRSGKLMRERRIFNELRDFREDLESSGTAPMSIKARLTGVRSFFNFYNITLPVLPRSATSARPLMENRAIPEKEDIQEVLEVADTLEKALVLMGVSSGLAVNEISNLTVKRFMDGYDKETEITTLHLIREKVGYEFYTFLTPEASRAVWAYLEYRGRTSDSKDKVRQNQLLKQRVRYDRRGNPTGYLFINRAIPNEYLEIKNEREAEELRKLTPKSIQKTYRELNEKARKSSPFGKRNLVRSHGIRKFFNSTMLANGAEIFFVDFLMGHQIDGTRDAYYRADPVALKNKYEKYIPWLTIKKELNVSESPEYKKVISENEILARETAKATVERAELQDLRKKMEAVPQTVDDQIQKLMESKLEELVESRLNDLLKGVK